jgi:uncharacterized protein YecE (DUF72 family)
MSYDVGKGEGIMKRPEPRVHIGMGGWDLPPFARTFYPPAEKGFRKLHYYSQFFDFVELNASFYNHSFSPAQVSRWIDDVSHNHRFVFTVKLFKGFTHTYDAGKAEYRSICRMLDQLGNDDKLGGLVVQFPTSFTNTADRRRYMTDLSRAFKAYKIFVEVRHHSWNSPLMFNFFQESGVHLINVDLPPLQKHMPFLTNAWNGSAYFRMMGRNESSWNQPYRLEPDGRHIVSERYRYTYSEDELIDLERRIASVRKEQNESFVVFHNDAVAKSLLNGFQLKQIINGTDVLVPDRLLETFPSLKQGSVSVNVSHPLFTGLPLHPAADQGIPVRHSVNY